MNLSETKEELKLNFPVLVYSKNKDFFCKSVTICLFHSNEVKVKILTADSRSHKCHIGI